MANQKDVAFRTALSGYKREDVNAYIINIIGVRRADVSGVRQVPQGRTAAEAHLRNRGVHPVPRRAGDDVA